MGALHAGHLSLVTHAQAGCDVVMASIFVNPLQFGPTEDLARYPRDLDGDAKQLRDAGVQLLFAPEVASMIAADAQTFVEVAHLGDRLCGARRPGHFRGVTTIVSKLLHVLQPHVAVFGLKDAQQAVLLRRMVRDLDFPVQLRFAPIVRDADGLALSSRNAYLTLAERHEALRLHRSLAAATQSLQRGERRAKVIVETVRRSLQQGPPLHIDYIECVDIESLQPMDDIEGRLLLALSVQVGDTHLIDNVILEVRGANVRHVDLDGNELVAWTGAHEAREFER
jgi:pantoate--beta-alanine ligase